jgi:hypothetical protein
VADEVTQLLVLFDDQQVIGRLSQQTLAHAFAQLLKRISFFSRPRDRSIDQVIESFFCVFACTRKNSEAAAASPLQPFTPHQVLIRLADGVVMHLQTAREFPHTGQKFASRQSLSRDQKDELFGELTPDRNSARTVDE